MVIIILGLLSLSAIYFTHLLYKRNLKTAAICVSILFAAIVAWVYFVFIFDVADFGFTDIKSRESLLFGSNIYSSFVDLNAEMALLPTSILQAIVAVSMLAFSAAITVVLDGVFRVAGKIYESLKSIKINKQRHFELKIVLPKLRISTVSLNKLYCRANC